MPARVHRWQRVAAVVALAAVVAIVVVGVVGTGGGGRNQRAASDPASTAPTDGAVDPSTTTAPDRADVDAARACAAFTVYLEDASHGRIPGPVGRTLIEDAAVLLGGAATDKKAGRALPRWSALGSDLLSAAEDVVAHRGSALRSDGPAAAAQCRLVPASAAAAGGYRRGS